MTQLIGQRNLQQIGKVRAELAVKRLGSRNPEERQAAATTLQHGGPRAIQALLEALRVIAIDKEFLIPPKSTREEASRIDQRSEAWSILTLNVLELVGQLHIKRAVPYLVEVMEKRMVDNAFVKSGEEMRSLVAIGGPAVPWVISSMEHAEATARRDRGRRADAATPSDVIEARAAIVLGDIGDHRAVAPLQQMLKKIEGTTEGDIFGVYFETAIKKIMRQDGFYPGMRLPPLPGVTLRPDGTKPL